MAALRFGPNNAAAEQMLDTLNHLETPELVTLAAAGGGEFGDPDPDAEAREALREELRGIARSSGRLDAVRAMSEEVEQWATSVRHWFPAGVSGTANSRGEMASRLAAVRVILDAAYGVVLEDLLRPAEVELLLRVWRDTVADDAEPLSDDGLGSADDAEPLSEDGLGAADSGDPAPAVKDEDAARSD